MSFHWRDGIYFQRRKGGGVLVYQLPKYGEAKTIMEIPALEWCSIVAAVSPTGDGAETFAQAKKLHGIS